MTDIGNPQSVVLPFTLSSVTATFYDTGTTGTTTFQLNQYRSGSLIVSVTGSVASGLGTQYTTTVVLSGSLVLLTGDVLTADLNTVASTAQNITIVAATTGGGVAAGSASYLPISTGALSGISANEIVGTGKTVRAQTIENIVVVAAAFSCVANPVLTLLDCGTSTGTCTAGTVTLGTVTITGANTQILGTVSTSSIAAGHYWAWEITSGTCASLNATGTAEATMQ